MATEEIVPVEVPAAPAPEPASKADYDSLVAQVATLQASLGEAGKKLEVIDRVKDQLTTLITGKEASTLTVEEQAVVKELQRLMPHILPDAGALKALPDIAQTVQAASRAAAESLVQAAYGCQLELQQEAGLKVDDPKVNKLISAGLKEWINEDKTRRDRFWRGDRTVLKEGFDEVKAVISGGRRADKAATLSTVTARPRSTSPAGSPGANGEAPPTVDFNDKRSVREAFKSALAG